MTAEWFELGQRAWAATHHQIVPRLTHRVVANLEHAPAVVAVHAEQRGRDYTVTGQSLHDPTRWTLTGEAALRRLDAIGATVDAPAPPILVTESASTVRTLGDLARQHASAHDVAVRSGAAVAGYWADRLDMPGTAPVVLLAEASRTRWLLGTDPAAERLTATWRSWLNITAPSTAGMLEWAQRLAQGSQLPYLADVHALDQRAWDRWRHSVDYWTRPATVAGAAMDLRTRCDAADLIKAGLLTDRLWRRRAVHSGEVVTGEAVVAERQCVIAADRLDARLRTGNAIEGWAGTLDLMPFERFHGEVKHTSVIDGRLHITVECGRAARPSHSDPVIVMPAAPIPARLGAGRGRYWSLFAGSESWLSKGTAPIPARRDVPLDVLIAGAETEQDSQ